MEVWPSTPPIWFLTDCADDYVIDRFFDHYAHLGGAAFGALYYTYGMRVWDAMRVHTLESARCTFLIAGRCPPEMRDLRS